MCFHFMLLIWSLIINAHIINHDEVISYDCDQTFDFDTFMINIIKEEFLTPELCWCS